jgi:DNA-3-methyladenine glycosylase
VHYAAPEGPTFHGKREHPGVFPGHGRPYGIFSAIKGWNCGDSARPERLRFRLMSVSPRSTVSATIRPLARAFFARNPRRVARELLGKVLVRQGAGELSLTARIVEVEAYLGKDDPAAHSAAGNTARTSVLFGPPGHAYVYFIYGNHYCLNVSCEREGRAGSVLFRALEPLSGLEEMALARSMELHSEKDWPKLTSGPGRLCEAFGITRARDNGCDLTSAAGSLWIGDDGYRTRRIRVTTRIGITKAAEQPLRYILEGSRFISGKIPAKSTRPERGISAAGHKPGRSRNATLSDHKPNP